MAMQDAPPKIADLVTEIESEAGRIMNGFVEVKIYVTNNVMENFDITVHKRNKGRISPSATN